MKTHTRRIRSIVLVLLACFVLAAMSGCTERQRKNLKHLKSDIIGLKRRVTLYDCSGKVIRQWEGRFKIEVQGAYLSFIDDNGKDIKVSGTVVVEEL
jgi:predicted small secreted protein